MLFLFFLLATLDQLSPDSGYGIALLNGGITDGSQYVQVSPSGAVFNNFIPVGKSYDIFFAVIHTQFWVFL